MEKVTGSIPDFDKENDFNEIIDNQIFKMNENGEVWLNIPAKYNKRLEIVITAQYFNENSELTGGVKPLYIPIVLIPIEVQFNVTKEISWKYYQKDEETGEFKRAEDPNFMTLTHEKFLDTGKLSLNPGKCYSINDKIFVQNSFTFAGKHITQAQYNFESVQTGELEFNNTNTMFIEGGFLDFKYVKTLSQSQAESSNEQYFDININDYSLNDILETVICNDNIQRKLINYQKLLELESKTFECLYKATNCYDLVDVDNYWEMTKKLSFS